MCGGSEGNKRGKRPDLLRGQGLSGEATIQWEGKFLTQNRTLKVFEEHYTDGQIGPGI